LFGVAEVFVEGFHEKLSAVSFQLNIEDRLPGLGGRAGLRCVPRGLKPASFLALDGAA
jgi:hypothetical protein